MTTIPFSNADDLGATLNTRKMRSNTWLEFSLSKNSDWVKNLLLELNENAEEMSPEQQLATSELNLEIQLKKANKSSIGDYLLCSTKVSSTFNTQCVKTGSIMNDSLDFSVKICFLPEHLSNQEEFLDQTEYYTDGEIYELYYLNKNDEAPLKEAIREQLFLNLDFYPTLKNQ